jgi:glycosyltransferase involved in cell wall biosynthesis
VTGEEPLCMNATRQPRLLSVQPVGDGGGSETALILMIRQLAAAGWECHVAVPPPVRLAAEYRAAGAVVHTVPMARLTTSGSAARWLAYAVRWPVTVGRLARLARRLDASVIHSNSLHCWYGWAAAALTGRPHVWHAREIVFQSALALRVERWLTRHFADTVIAGSEAIAAQLQPAPVTVIRDEADPERFRPDRAGRFRVDVGIGDGAPLVGSVARLDTWKGFDVLLDALTPLRKARPDVELVIAGGAVPGKEDYAAGLRSRAAALPGVHWLGPRYDVPDLMADLDVFVQVSTAPEPFGLVLVEALASGVPVVAGAEGGPLEIVSGGPTGRVVPPGDPAALATAVLALLPVEPSSAASRQGRHPLRDPQPARYAALFDRVAAYGRRRS